jgi:GT2 family glycosyltransferase
VAGNQILSAYPINPKAKVLIVTPTLGTSRFLPETVASIEQFRSVVDHVLVAPEGKVEVLKQEYTKSIVIAEPSSPNGLYAAIAHAISKYGHHYEWFTWINDDDRLEIGFGSVLAKIEQNNPDLVYGNVVFIDSTDSYICDVPVARSRLLLGWCLNTGQVPFTQQGGLIRITSFKSIGGFNLQFALAADTDLFFRLLKNGATVAYANAWVASYRMIKGQLSSDAAKQQCEHKRMLTMHGCTTSVFIKFFVRIWFVMENIRQMPARIGRHRFKSIRQIMTKVGNHRSFK